MQNGYFQLVKAPGGFGVKIVPPIDGGEDIRINELLHYLEGENIKYELSSLKKVLEENKERVCMLGLGDCPAVDERYLLDISADAMSVTARFIPPSETGKRLSVDEVINDLKYRNIVEGIQTEILQKHFNSDNLFCTDLIIAKGTEPKHGEDDKIEYYFNTDVNAQPEEKEDGTVDYFNLNMINHCKAGDVLARIIKGEAGKAGVDINGKVLPPREQKRAVLRHGKNIELSEDGLSITSMVDGHVMLVGRDVFVSDVYEVENVDTSTGNIDYTGSVQINGNVTSNFTVNAGGNVIINGVVEGAQINAGGNIIIARGMNGMSKGVLKAGGNVIARFLENATVEADGYINAGSILHSKVKAGTEIVVNGKRGFITGGHVQAGNQITVKTLGAMMGASTIVEVGIDPKIKSNYAQLQKDITELVKVIKGDQLILSNFAEKRSKGVKFTVEQVNYIRGIAKKVEENKAELSKKNNEFLGLRKFFETQSKAQVIVKGEVHPGTTIIIGDLSMVIQNTYHYCRFEVVHGDVKSVPL